MIWSHINLPQLKTFYKNNGYVHIKQFLNTKMKNDLIKINEIEYNNRYENKKNTNYLNQYEYSNNTKASM